MDKQKTIKIITLPNGEICYLHLGRYNSGSHKGKLYLYSISKDLPKNMESCNPEAFVNTSRRITLFPHCKITTKIFNNVLIKTKNMETIQ